MQEQQNNPFNSRFLVAMIIFALFYFGWNSYLQNKYPNYGKKPVSPTSANTINTDPTKTSETPANTDIPAKQNTALQNSDMKTESQVIEEKKFNFENNNISFDISSKGMGFLNLKVKTYTDREGNPIHLGQSQQIGLFEMRLVENKPLFFDLTEVEKGHYKGSAKLDDIHIQREIKFNEGNNSFESTINISGLDNGKLSSVKLLVPEKIMIPKNTSWLFPSYEHQDFYISHANTTSTVNFSAAKENLNQEIKTANLISLGSQYFATAILDKSETIPDAKLNIYVNDSVALGELNYPILSGKSVVQLKQVFYAGPKSITALSAISDELPEIINFGWLGFIAKPLLFTMKWFFSQIPNWGIAIILLTLLVRLFVLPFNLMSMKSMKAMQKIQPEMTAIREKYKEDPMRMNQEIMTLMKNNKANPFGGCLPMLLQIPIFFALYRVIGSSIELYQSPFMLWINDLSAHDKFYVLPVLMGATMFIQQKMTPTNMDPTQAKILLYMPLVMSVFMLNLPSGLTLYMFVSGLFGIIQQYFMLKTKST